MGRQKRESQFTKFQSNLSRHFRRAGKWGMSDRYSYRVVRVIYLQMT